MTEQYDPEVVDAPRQQVDRKRRARFVAMVVGFSLLSATGLTLAGVSTATMPALVEGLLSLATILSLWYVSGSVVDYNGGFGGMVRRPRSTTRPKSTGLKPRS